MSLDTLSPPATPPDAPPPHPAGRIQRLLRGPADQPGWARPALLALLVGTAVLYLWGLSASGNGNSFYAAAVQAGTQSWKAFLFGSFDAGNFITVDKPPVALWVMELSGRLFGFSSWSMLAPQALEGVASVALLYAAVRRWSGPFAGLCAGTALALTPVAVLMFRFNNPDALLTLLLVAGAYATVRAVEKASVRWLMLAGAAVGFGFLTKMLQALLVLPAFGLVYLIAAPTSVRRRLLHLLAGAGALIASAGWWVATVELWPAASRPYIGGSTSNSVLELAFGYNGISRLTGGGTGVPGGSAGGAGSAGGPGGGGAGGGASFGGASGLTRLFGDAMGTQISWLLPAALIGLVAGLWLTRRAPRTDKTRAALVLWGLWLLVTGAVFSFMQGIIHPYYMIALAPAIGAVLAISARELWRRRDNVLARGTLALQVAASGWWGYVLLARTPTWHPELRYPLLGVTVLAIVAVLLSARQVARVAVVGLVLAVVAGLLGTASYAVDTAATAHTGSIPSAGPAGAGGGFGGGTGTRGAFPGGAPGTNSATSGAVTGAGPAGGFGGSGNGGGLGGEQAVDAALTALLRSAGTHWAAATSGSMLAGSLELASGTAVMSIGGFNGGDPAPSLAAFQTYVTEGKVRYYIGGAGGGGGGFGGGGGPGGSGSEIATWVAAHFAATTIGGQTVYDLTKPN